MKDKMFQLIWAVGLRLFLLICFFLCFLLLGFYLYYIYKYPDPLNKKLKDLSKHYPPDLILKTGAKLHPPEKRFQHFLNFPPAKPKGALRIGAFGDSHTYGKEVYKTEAYPYQLQELLNQRFPNKHIEVLNFGVSGAGFHEQFFLYQEYAKKFELDYILLGPKGFWPRRDLNFRRSRLLPFLSYPKSRFILSQDNGLRLAHIKGETLEERRKNYYSFFPSFTVFRYNREIFPFWQYLYPALLKTPNPFYYTPLSMDEEAFQINKRLLKKIEERHHKKILFFTRDERVFRRYQPLARLYNINLILEGRETGAYKRFSHGSSLNNELLANIYFNALLGHERLSVKIIGCSFFKKPLSRLEKPHGPAFDAISSIQIMGGSTALASLNRNTNYYRSYSGATLKETKSLLFFSNKEDLIKTVYFSLPIPLREGMPLGIKLKNGESIKWGAIRPLTSARKVFGFYTKSLRYWLHKVKGDKDSWRITFNLYPLLREIKALSKKPVSQDDLAEARLLVGNHEIGHLRLRRKKRKSVLVFVPSQKNKKTFLMMGPGSGKVREKNFPDEFALSLKITGEGGKALKSLIPDWTCKKENLKIHLSLPNFEPLK